MATVLSFRGNDLAANLGARRRAHFPGLALTTLLVFSPLVIPDVVDDERGIGPIELGARILVLESWCSNRVPPTPKTIQNLKLSRSPGDTLCSNLCTIRTPESYPHTIWVSFHSTEYM